MFSMERSFLGPGGFEISKLIWQKSRFRVGGFVSDTFLESEPWTSFGLAKALELRLSIPKARNLMTLASKRYSPYSLHSITLPKEPGSSG